MISPWPMLWISPKMWSPVRHLHPLDPPEPRGGLRRSATAHRPSRAPPPGGQSRRSQRPPPRRHDPAHDVHDVHERLVVRWRRSLAARHQVRGDHRPRDPPPVGRPRPVRRGCRREQGGRREVREPPHEPRLVPGRRSHLGLEGDRSSMATSNPRQRDGDRSPPVLAVLAEVDEGAPDRLGFPNRPGNRVAVVRAPSSGSEVRQRPVGGAVVESVCSPGPRPSGCLAVDLGRERHPRREQPPLEVPRPILACPTAGRRFAAADRCSRKAAREIRRSGARHRATGPSRVPSSSGSPIACLEMASALRLSFGSVIAPDRRSASIPWRRTRSSSSLELVRDLTSGAPPCRAASSSRRLL